MNKHFRVRTVRTVVILAITSIVVFYGALRRYRAKHQRTVVERLRSLGTRVLYEHEYFPECAGRPPGLGWLESILGENMWLRVAVVNFKGAQITQNDLRYLRDLEFSVLNVSCTPIEDEWLTHVVHCKGISAVDLSETNITDEGVKILGANKSLESVELRQTRISDAVGATLVQHPHLVAIDLANTSIGDECIETISRLENVRQLDLSGTKITDECVSDLVTMRSLVNVWLGGTEVSDDAVAKLRGALPYTGIHK